MVFQTDNVISTFDDVIANFDSNKAEIVDAQREEVGRLVAVVSKTDRMSLGVQWPGRRSRVRSHSGSC